MQAAGCFEGTRPVPRGVLRVLKAKVCSAEQGYGLIRQLRQEKSVPILAEIKTWLDVEKELVLPRSPMGGAITYVLNQWAALNRYVEQGYLKIDNNVAERAVKRVAIGRKNWLFAGHDESGAAHAILWSLLASAERHGLSPQRYMTSVLAKIGQAKLSELEQFLPDVWKADLAAEAAAARTHCSFANRLSDLKVGLAERTQSALVESLL